jgi:hypothetical protein
MIKGSHGQRCTPAKTPTYSSFSILTTPFKV